MQQNLWTDVKVNMYYYVLSHDMNIWLTRNIHTQKINWTILHMHLIKNNRLE